MKTSLNFSWKFVPDFQSAYLKKFPEKYQEINIPHNAFEVPYNYFNENDYQKVVTYQKDFDIENFNKNRRYFIRFDGFMVQAHIYLNNEDLGNHISVYNPVEIEISKFAKEKDNRLVVVLDTREDKDIPPFGFALDYVTYSGIYREVYLIDEPQTYLRNIYVHGDSKGNVDIIYDKVGNDEININHRLMKGDLVIYETDKNQFKIVCWKYLYEKKFTLVFLII